MLHTDGSERPSTGGQEGMGFLENEIPLENKKDFSSGFKKKNTFSSSSAEYGSFHSSLEDHLDLVNEEEQGHTLKMCC